MTILRARFYAPALLAAIGLFAFMPCVANDFVDWDDYGFVKENPHIRDLSYTSLLRMVTGFHQGVWHPLTWLSHAADRSLWGLNPSAHHLVSVVLHALNGALVFLVCLMLQDAWKERNSREAVPTELSVIAASFTAGLLFAVHPLRVESVAWISGRKDLLCALFFLSALLSYVGYVCRREVSPARGRRWYASAVVFHGLAVLSKPTAVVLPLVLLLLDYYPLYRMDPSVFLRRVVEKAPFWVIGGIGVVMNMAAKWGESIPLSYVPASVRIMNAFHSVVAYIVQTAAPLTLIPLYPMDLSTDHFGPEYVLAAAMVTAVTGLCLFSALRGRRLWAGVCLYYLITLSPSLGLFMSFRHCAADRYTYLPSVGLCLLMGLGVGRLWDVLGGRRHRLIGRAALCAAVMTAAFGCLIKSRDQMAVWRNTETLWLHVVKHARPVPDIAYFALGKVYESRDDFTRALEAYRKALSLNPGGARIKGRIAVVLARTGKTAEARELALGLIEADPRQPDAYVTLAGIEGSMGRYDEAVRSLEQALRLEPEYPPALGLLIVAHVRRNDLGRARYYYGLYTEKGFTVPREIEETLSRNSE
ncbi:MAG: tetratricopeptide repeat protein [Pseudomonadota bacterium]